MREFTEAEKTVLRRAQGNLPDSATPYADLAAEAGVTETEVLTLLGELKDAGAIRRLGATLRHQKAGYSANAMVAWKVPDPERIAPAGEALAGHARVSHCYWRPGSEDWPYDLYTMVHARSPKECQAVIQDLSDLAGLEEYTVLRSLKELKKTSMTYF